MSGSLKGILAATLTPLYPDGRVDRALLVRHCRWLLDNGCDGLSILGTTGEGNSFTVDERLAIFEELAEARIPGSALLPGTGCCALPDAVRLSRRAVEIGAAGVLLLPPFYYKNVSDDGVFAFVAGVVERIGDRRLRVYLYHFPQMAGVGYGSRVIERLLVAYPDTIAGMKDSSGDLANMIENAHAFPNFAVFSGSDEFLLPLLREGGAGCITAVCNVAAVLAAEVRASFLGGDAAAAERVQEMLTQVRKSIATYPLTAALKEIMARHGGNEGWRHLRPPLMPLEPAQTAQLLSALDRLQFRPPAQS